VRIQFLVALVNLSMDRKKASGSDCESRRASYSPRPLPTCVEARSSTLTSLPLVMFSRSPGQHFQDLDAAAPTFLARSIHRPAFLNSRIP